MGVHGLTSFVNKHQPRLSKTHVLTSPTPKETPTAFIIDGLAFTAYILHSSVGSVTLDGARGGNYTAMRRYVKRIIEYIRAVGLEPEFVWDGAHSVSKLSTIKERTEQKIAAVREFMSFNDDLRGQADLISNATGSPLLTRSTFIYVLNEMKVKIHFASGEADSPTAEMAQRRNGYAVSNDSDFFIFPAECRGYVPVDSIRFGHNRSPLLEPAHSTTSPRLEFEVFQPARIAASLNLSLHRLPLLAALAGNDLADYYKHFKFASPPTRYGRVWVDHRAIASRLGCVRSTTSSHESALRQVLPSMMMTTLGTKMLLEKIISNLTTSAAGYTLQPIEDLGPDFLLSPRSSDTANQAECRKLYREKALGTGNLTTLTLQALQTGIAVPNNLLEEPKLPATAVSMGRPLRKMVYAVLDDAIGLGRSSIEEYCRQGSYLQSVRINISRLGSLVEDLESSWSSPIILAPEHERVRFLCALLRYEGTIPLHSNRAWPYFSLILALRHLQRHSTTKWSKATLLAAIATAVIVKLQPTYDRISERIKLPAAAPLNHLHRSAELLQTSHALQSLMEALLLCDRMVPLHITFDGSMVHRLWSLGDGAMETLGEYLTESQLDLVEEVMGMVEEE
ncbi:hypothetical protein MVLG_00364 [Microbotryum lychnidis-dioicae p1A1 Lamole]|uniref:Asteroid domain-containing protein n=1 Tax=Microbotryum lychnidis-dioicae (strain p1A1 Lamole / MvSl-1064) TaxID=683840 RepID=U5GYV3_USTV1|nr:hypothetical protein MVLG_00364 [Microbotryum lychnidis-dioicae p1A1 Lamole]|eukprot:KDE09462.1 hypothetical protein MVLG_00364 [Microbotryum lychnidis-dioicae p1A1 Lamole]